MINDAIKSKANKKFVQLFNLILLLRWIKMKKKIFSFQIIIVKYHHVWVYQAIYYEYNINDDDDNGKYEKEKLLNKYFLDNKYIHLINDYQHILLIHLNDADNKINDKNYNHINQSMTKSIQCNIKHCILYQRNMGNRYDKNDEYNTNIENK